MRRPTLQRPSANCRTALLAAAIVGSWAITMPVPAKEAPAATVAQRSVFGRDGRATSCEVAPPGQSGFIAPDGTRAKHYQDQLEMFGRFDGKPTWLDAKDVDRHLESKTVLRY